MATKPYPPKEETSCVAQEPAVAYHRTDPATYRDFSPSKPTNESDDETLDALMKADVSDPGDGFRPFTWREARKWIAEAESEDKEGTLAEDFFAELKAEFPWLK